MRLLIVSVIIFVFSSYTLADSTKILQPVTDLSEFSRSSQINNIEWNNHRPEQRRALNQFYQSINQTGQPQTQPSAQREQRVQQMRRMNPQQRQQMFLNYIQNNR